MKEITEIPKLSPRAADAHKGDFGKVCIIAGSFGMAGAAALAGRSALRAGAGLLRVATPKSTLPTVASIEPSFTTIPLAEDSEGRITLFLRIEGDEDDYTRGGPARGHPVRLSFPTHENIIGTRVFESISPEPRRSQPIPWEIPGNGSGGVGNAPCGSNINTRPRCSRRPPRTRHLS